MILPFIFLFVTLFLIAFTYNIFYFTYEYKGHFIVVKFSQENNTYFATVDNTDEVFSSTDYNECINNSIVYIENHLL